MKWNRIVVFIVVAMIVMYLLWRNSAFDSGKANLFRKVSNDWSKQIQYASNYFNVSDSLITAIICVESGGDENATGSSYDVGLMQVTPGAYQEFKQKYAQGFSFGFNTSSPLFDPDANVAVGTGYLRILYDRFNDWDSAIMAYNTGTVGSPQGLAYLERVKSFRNQQFF